MGGKLEEEEVKPNTLREKMNRLSMKDKLQQCCWGRKNLMKPTGLMVHSSPLTEGGKSAVKRERETETKRH